MVEINHSNYRNFFALLRFQLLEASGPKQAKRSARIRISPEGFSGSESGGFMRYLKYVALLAVLMVPLAYSQAQVSVGIGVGPVGVVVGHPYVEGPPVCEYGYYDYYPYACAPYGYYGPSYFVNGVFIGAGPWYRGYYHRDWDGDRWRHEAWEHDRGWGYGHDAYRGYGREGYGHAYGNRGYDRAYNGRQFQNRGYERGYNGGQFRAERGFRSEGAHRGYRR